MKNISLTRRIIAAVCAATIIGTTAACSSDGNPRPVWTPAAAQTTTVQPPSIDDRFIAVISDEIPNAGPAHIDLAKSVCNAFDHGATLGQVIRTMLAANTLTPTQVGSIIGAGVMAYCPEHADLLPKGTDA